MQDKKMPVLCCCDPSNEVGIANAGLPGLKTREYDDENGGGTAYPSGAHGGDNQGIDWKDVPGFEMAHRKGGQKKTWRDKKKPTKKSWRDTKKRGK